MEIYFVRHGETDGNIARRHQVEKTGITKIGREQAGLVAKEIVEINPTHLISSNLVRALETARVIGDSCNLIPETSTLFTELKRPSFLYGNYHFSLKSLWFYVQWYFGFGAGAKEGETYDLLLNRIKDSKEYFTQFPNHSRIVVVTHSVFITLFVMHICHEKKISIWQATKAFWRVYKMKNTQITLVLFDNQDTIDDLNEDAIGDISQDIKADLDQTKTKTKTKRKRKRKNENTCQWSVAM